MGSRSLIVRLTVLYSLPYRTTANTKFSSYAGKHSWCDSGMPVTITDLPEESLTRVLESLDLHSLAAISLCSRYLRSLCLAQIWPSHAAKAAGVRALQHDGKSKLLTVSDWARFVDRLLVHRASRTLHIAVQLERTDSVSSLALKYAVSPHEICRSNALLSEHHAATRDYLYIPLTSESAVLTLTGAPISCQRPVLVRDCTLAGRDFLVVHFRRRVPRPIANNTSDDRESYVRELIVRLVAKGLSVDESEVRFYLEDNEYDLPRACKALLKDREWSNSRA